MAARLFLRLANLQGGFGNREDDLGGLRKMLEDSFQEVEIETPSDSVAYLLRRVLGDFSRPSRPPLVAAA
jgi:hypothetical protein